MRGKKEEKVISLEDRLGSDVLKRLEQMAGEFVRFERGQFGFYIDPARYAVKQRQVGPLGRGRRRKVVAGVDKDGNVITAWIGVDAKAKGTKTEAGETVNIPDGYGDGAPGGGGGGGGGGGSGGKGKGKGGGGSGTGGGTGEGDGEGDGEGSGGGGGDGSGGGDGTGEGKGKGDGGGGLAKKDDQKKSAAEIAKEATEKRNAKNPDASKAPGAAADAPAVDAEGKPAAPPAPKPPTADPMQAKENEARGRKKKPFHWAKVPKNLLKETIWLTLQDGQIKLDTEEIDDLFGIEVAAAFSVEAEEVKPEVLPHKRKHNVNILLANLKMSPDEIKDVIRIPTYKELESANLQALLVVCPTAEEEQLLVQNANMKDQVDKTDRFMMELAEVPGLRGKILCALAAKTFNDEAVDVIRNMDTFAMIPEEIMKSEKLNKTLELILALGNFLNSGTARGGAHGFKLEAMAMLTTVKDSKGDTLLDYLVRIIRREFDYLLPLDDMPTLERSSAISLDAIGEDVQSLLDTVTNVSEQIRNIGDDPMLTNFKNEMVSFQEEAVKVREEIVSLRGLMMDKLQAMMGHFGERNKAARGRQEDILRMLREFVQELKNVTALAEEKEERENKKAAKAGKKGAAKKPSERTKDAGNDEGAGAATSMDQDGGGDASDLLPGMGVEEVAGGDGENAKE